MQIGPSADQLSLRDGVREVLASDCPLTLDRRVYEDGEAWQPLWHNIVDLGWTWLARRGYDDGAEDLGLTTLDLVLTLEALGSALAPIPFVSSVGMAAGVARAGGRATDALLSAIAGGTVATLAAHSPTDRLPGATMTLSAGRVRGEAIAVPDAVNAELLVVLGSDGDDTTMAVVPTAGDGVVIQHVDSADPARPLATVTVDAPAELTVPVEIETALGPALLAIAAELVGVAHAALDIAVEHAKNRHQFDRPIGSFQAIKHGLADNRVSVERARSLAYLAAARVDDESVGPAERWRSCALAKAAAGDAALAATRTAVQVLGALGQTWEHDIHLYLRRAWLGAAQLGDSSSLYHLEGKRFMAGAGR
ncbi:alkylation response protein AidB-like acyl-CoA dehydrogenase [Mycolicibacterium sp. BK556]|uniref:acyl-CoA dehydrogenase family protein n=1 Tax=Mycobacteriaceae TaxID=1762 RepID=UPI00105D59A2|nr:MULTISPECIES: acyl-CoA dehydrogenase family protein [Mycobacteriaceae]MBB3602837.1 alkylation response protein AidB-like acyl-CoA dehydrogenase [Mycolicibacterium sp. BK556]MBB3633032.1 alkylation response protein AidB-like acyl-CoA dehydrogenase [Mycolicibacterium sp. BK607]TDO07007.1 alkylation response protein AidB-like acyl-CoA dehydrogenase [Mycobacterium sp. BK086]